MESQNKISTGSADLDKWLFGGYEKDIITTIFGPAGCGKSNFSILASVHAAKDKGKVIFIDTEGGFSVERVRQMCRDAEDTKKVLENIVLLKPTNFEEQWAAFGKLLKEIRENNNISLIVVDGMTMLYRLELAEAKKEKNIEQIEIINSKLAKQMRLLAEISRKRNIPVVITNQVYSEFLSEKDFDAGKERGVFMVGGDILKYWSKCIIELKNSRGKRTAVLRKHRALPEKSLDFEIIDAGIKKRGWL